MELRGLGLINVKELFGIASTRSSKRVELVIQLERWDPLREYERLGRGTSIIGCISTTTADWIPSLRPGCSLEFV